MVFNRISRYALGAVICLAWASTAAAQLPFFPGAEGYGGTWSGTAPAGGWLSEATASVYHVTNLNDSGAGSFRGAFAENSSNKIIVFDVAGTITLTSGKLDIKNLANYYIAGQTAPGPITVYGDMVQLTHSSGKENRNVVLRYMSFRKGAGDNEDSITFAGSGLGTNMIFDHLSASWSEDEILSVTNNNTNVTFQYSMINDALVAGHAYGSLLRAKIDSNVTIHHNLYANNKSRQARFGSYDTKKLTADFRNNVIYNWGDRASYAGGSGDDDREYADVNYVGNYLLAGPATTPSGSLGYVRAEKAFLVDQTVDARVYQSGNAIDSDRTVNPGGVPNGSDTGWGMFHDLPNDGVLTQMATPFATPTVTTQTAAAAYDQVINHVGNWWWDRGVIDQRVINDVKNFTGPPAIGPAAPPAGELSSVTSAPLITRPAGWDTDGDGIPNAWETAHGLNPNSAADNKLDFDNDGYINVIEYINEAGEFPAPAPIVFNGSASTRYAQIMNWKTSDGITTGSNWQPSKYDVAVVRTGTVVVDAIGQHAGDLVVAPLAGDSATLNVIGGWIDVADTLDVAAEGAGQVNHSGGLVIAENAVLGGAVGASGIYNLTGSGMLVVGTLAKGASGGAFNMTGGTLSANTVAFTLVNNGGTISPGASPGTTHVVGDLINTSGTIRMELAGTSEGQFDHIDVDGALAAGGTLDIDLLGGYMPASGASFDLFDFASASGSFTLSLPTLTGGLEWKTASLLTTGVLSVGLPGLPPSADFDGDHDVDGDDLLTWQRGLGLTMQGTNSNGDANRNGVVNGDDLAVWRSQFGTPQSVVAGAPVPEPTASVLALLAGALSFAVRRRRS